MNKKMIFLIGIIIVLGVVAFIIMYNQEENHDLIEDNSIETIESTENANSTSESEESKRLKITVNGEELYVNLEDNATSNDLLNQLPLTLEFEDFNNVEKIAYLPEELSLDNAPDGYDPEIGDLAYYAPWGNLVFYYQDFRYSNSLIKLGELESGVEVLQQMNGNFSMVIELEN